MKKQKVLQITAAVLALGFSLACGVNEQVAEQLGQAVQTVKETAVPFVATAAPSIQLPTQEPTSENAIRFDEALDNLSSYRLTLHIEVTGTESGAETRSMEMLSERIRSEGTLHSRVTNGEGGSDGFEIYGSNGETFIYQPENEEKPCTIVSASAVIPFEIGLTSVDQIFRGLEKDELIEPGVIVNGVKTDRYTGKNLSTLIGTLDSYQTEVWLAQFGEYPVRFTGEALGTLRFFEMETSGTIRWMYDLTEINKLASIELPAACEEARHVNDDIPLPWNASEKKNFGGLVSFTTPDNSETVAEFYRSELPVNDWIFEENTSAKPLILFRISKDSRVLQLSISPLPTGGSLVVLTEWNP